MIIDSKKYNGVCACGHTHTMSTEFCIIERGCLKNIEAYIKKYGLRGYSVAIYDENTYNAIGISHPAVDKEIILPKKDLHADNHGVALLKEKLPKTCGYLIAVGSGTVHDITRYCAYELDIPFISCPTAASVDGFCSSVAAMTWNGFKKTFTAVSPKIVVADLDVIMNAPSFLTKSGFGDMIGKFIALFDWKMSGVLLGEYFCEKIYNMTMEATKSLVSLADGINNGDESAYESLTYGLLMSGLAMQLLGNSRCASGAEHHISHLIEMQPDGLGASSNALHGEKVGVGTLIAASEYHRIKSLNKSFSDYPKIEADYIRGMFGDRLSDSIILENENDAASLVTKKLLEEKFSEVSSLIDEIPTPSELLAIYRKLGIKESLSDIGVREDILPLLIEFSPLVRNRLTLMRLRRAIVTEDR